MRDFTPAALNELYASLLANYSFIPMLKCNEVGEGRRVIIRHDVDRKPGKAVQMAEQEKKMGVSATYYFRTTRECMLPKLMQHLAELGHTVGYHYENLSSTATKLGIGNAVLSQIQQAFSPLFQQSMRPDVDRAEVRQRFESILASMDKGMAEQTNKLFSQAIRQFSDDLNLLKIYIPIETIAMHGSPFSAIDNRLIWLRYDYREYGIRVEPYFDIDYTQYAYLTDAGRSWYDPKANQRDKVQSAYELKYNHISEVCSATRKGELPEHILINIHPEHWTDSLAQWYGIYWVRSARNAVKRMLKRSR